jgi:hypothetical protein
MAIINRDLDPSEQLRTLGCEVITTAVGASAGNSYHVAQAPYPCTLKAVSIAAQSISGAPVVSLDVKRWTAAGVTTIPFVGSTLAVLAYGASAAYTLIPLSSSVTMTELQAGDVVVLNQNFSGGGVAIGGAAVTVGVSALQDYKTFFGVGAPV